METFGNLGLIQLYFEKMEPHARRVSMTEVKELTPELRSEIAGLIAKELGYTWNPDVKKWQKLD